MFVGGVSWEAERSVKSLHRPNTARAAKVWKLIPQRLANFQCAWSQSVPWEVRQVGDLFREGWMSVTQVLSWHPSCYWEPQRPPCGHTALWNWFSWIETLPLAKKRDGGGPTTQEVSQTYKTLNTHKIKRSKAPPKGDINRKQLLEQWRICGRELQLLGISVMLGWTVRWCNCLDLPGSCKSPQ